MASEAKISLHVMNAGLVVDRSVLVTLTAPEMSSVFATLRGAPKKAVTVIENGATFFTAANMLELIKSNDDRYKLIAEKAKVTLREYDVAAIKAAEAAKKAIEASMIPPIPPYPFATAPADFNVRKTFEVCNGGKSLRRIGGHHTLSLLQGQLIWRYMSEAWVNNRGVDSKYFRDHRVYQLDNSRFRIGCQEAYRYEIEQLALWQGWTFPTKA